MTCCCIFQSFTGCGVMNYDPAKKDEVRRGLRECLNHLEVKRSLLGPFEFSVSLGIAVDAPEKMPLIPGISQERHDRAPDSGNRKTAGYSAAGLRHRKAEPAG
ncbi:MAG: hypothetical protein ACLR0U_16025 [Enterocloster clostridioformis]